MAVLAGGPRRRSCRRHGAQKASRPSRGGIFDKMLKEPRPYHKGGANHKLEDCRMLKKHFDGLGFKKDARDDPKKEKGGDKEGNKDDDGFLPSTTAT